MDAQKIENGQRDDDQRLPGVSTDGGLVAAHQLGHCVRRPHGADGLEADPDDPAPGIPFDDLVVRRLPLPAHRRKVPVEHLMELLDDSRRDGDARGALVNEIEHISIAGDLLFGPVSRRGGPENDSLDSLVRRNDALDPIRRLAGLDDRDPLERLEDLRSLTLEQGLSSFVLPDRAEGRPLLGGELQAVQVLGIKRSHLP